MTSLHAPLKPISNGPRATLPTRPPPPVRMLLSKASPSVAISCTQCYKTLPIHPTVKWCESCRPKHGERIKLSKSGRVSQTHVMITPVGVNTTAFTQRLENSRRADTDVEMADATGGCRPSSSRSSTGAMKRKADAISVSSESLAVEEQPGEDVTPHMTPCKEFQTEQDLVRSLSEDLETFCASRATSAPLPLRYVNFRGSYTIVMDPDVRGERRVKQVVDGLKQAAKLPCGNIVKRDGEKSCGGHARTFWCACDPPQPHPRPESGEQSSSTSMPQIAPPFATPAPSRAGVPPKHTQSTLTGWLAKSQSKEKLGGEVAPLPPPGCGGTIIVYAVTDFSHPLGRMGIEGQKIVVQVEHPGRDLNRVLPR